MPLTIAALVVNAVLVAKVPLVVRTYDAVGLSSREFDRARASAGDTLAAAGIAPIWRPCHAALCAPPPKPHEIDVRIVNATALTPPGVLGSAAVDVDQHEGTLATVYADRVAALAALSGTDEGELLGRAVAHEVGHLVLGTVDHARHGVMRAAWTSAEVRRCLPLDCWRFSAAQGEEMRRQLAVISNDVVHSGLLGKNGRYHTFHAIREGAPSEGPS
jgi:hypothetical protein